MCTKLVSGTLLMNPTFVDWKVFAAWIETEGSIDSTVSFKLNPRTETYYAHVARAILIPQRERAPLVALQGFLKQHGIYSVIQDVMPSGTAFSKEPYFRLAIQRMDDIDRVIENMRGYLLTSKTLYRIEQYTHTRHMKSADLRTEYLGNWLEFRKTRQRRGGKGFYVY